MRGKFMLSRVLAGAAGVMLVVGLSGCAAGGSAEEASSQPAPKPSADFFSDVDTDDVPEEEPAPVPDPDGNYTSNCDYLLGSGLNDYWFIGGARVKNVGNVGIVAEVKAKWLQLGGSDVKETKKLRLDVGESRRVNFNIAATGDQIDRHQAIESGRTCNVKVSLVDTFGEPVS